MDSLDSLSLTCFSLRLTKFQLKLACLSGEDVNRNEE
jgi:hypothetical protein